LNTDALAVVLLWHCRANDSPLCAVTQDATTVGDIGQWW